jgi:histidine triad (HIT) family protein
VWASAVCASAVCASAVWASLLLPIRLMSECLFCKIVGGELPAAVVLDEPDVIAFLDISPVFPGHVLLIPRQHHVTLTDLPSNLLAVVFGAAQRIATAVQSVMGADGTWVSMNNVVSQSVPHLHVHIVPRKRKDGLRGFYWPRQKYASTDEMVSLAERIAAAIKP